MNGGVRYTAGSQVTGLSTQQLSHNIEPLRSGCLSFRRISPFSTKSAQQPFKMTGKYWSEIEVRAMTTTTGSTRPYLISTLQFITRPSLAIVELKHQTSRGLLRRDAFKVIHPPDFGHTQDQPGYHQIPARHPTPNPSIRGIDSTALYRALNPTE